MANLGIHSAQGKKHNYQLERDYYYLHVNGADAHSLLAAVPFLEADKAACANERLLLTLGTSDNNDLIPCITPQQLAALIPSKAKREASLYHLHDKRTKYLTRNTLARVAAVPGVQLPADLREILRDGLRFSKVRSNLEAGVQEVYDISVPGPHAFVANGILNHNTINMPAESTTEDIQRVYTEGWKKGLKSIAIYRDGSKSQQPMASSDHDKKAKEAEAVRRLESLLGDGMARGDRRRVPLDRTVVGRHFRVGQVSGYVHAGLFEDGTPGDIFVTVSQAGSMLRGFIDTWSVTFSMALQHGTPLDVLVSKLAFTSFDPAGMTNDPEIRSAKSIVDYVVRWLAAKFLDESAHAMLGISKAEVEEAREEEGLTESFAPLVSLSSETRPAAPPTATRDQAVKMAPVGTGICARCSGLMVQTGKCMTCTSCGDTGGCG